MSTIALTEHLRLSSSFFSFSVQWPNTSISLLNPRYNTESDRGNSSSTLPVYDHPRSPNLPGGNPIPFPLDRNPEDNSPDPLTTNA
ncbi:hypothetical protein BJ508DRAFT_31005 [Ascobolus immersus RN42]|uniref:Uncharacterized protein n=1 Tax=Ascobolus immersus RN42 TaxID=1160509 RepID=A0A3N4IED4_ASCIM|nr:hypothetical protein BJ508DRAFT_31005 [Ascobolus immersus RN42]